MNGLRVALEDGLHGENIETILPMDWEAYSNVTDGPWIVLNVKDYDLDYYKFEDNIQDFYDDWAGRFSHDGLLLGACGRSSGYWGFEEKNFLEYGIEIDEEGAKELYEEYKGNFELDDDEDAAFNAGYDCVFEDDRNVAKAYKVVDSVRKAMEDFELESESTREAWKNEDIDDFMNEDAE